jgi:O-antigen/teichoic acid export membrane protein
MVQVIGLRSLAMGVNIGTGLLTAAVLGPSGRGEQAALIVAPTFLAGLASLGLHGSLIYNLKADPEREGELLGAGMILTLLMGCIAAAIGWVLEPHWMSHYSSHAILIGRLLLLMTPVIVTSWSMSGAAESRGWFGLVNQTYYLQTLGTLVALALLAWAHLLTPTTSAFAYLGPILPSACYIWWTVIARMHPVFRIRRVLAKRLLHYGLRLSGVDMLGTLSQYVDQLVIVAYLAPSTVGTYAVALSSARMLSIVQTGISAVLFPSIAARSPAKVLETVSTTFRIASTLIASLAACLAVVGPYLLMLGYGARFSGSILPFRILLLAMVIENSARILYQAYSGSGRPGVVTLFECCGVTVSITVMLLLAPHLGAVGAACGVLSAACLRLLAGVIGLRVVLGLRRVELLITRRDLRMIMAAIARPAIPALEPEPHAMDTAT